MNLSAVDPIANGYFRSFAAGAAQPTTTVLNYRSGITITGAATVSLNNSGQLAVLVGSGGTKIVGHITGYFIPAVLSASIFADGTVNRGEGVDTTKTQRISAGTYEVGFTRDISECFFQVTAGEGGIGGATPRVTGVTRRSGNPNGLFIRVNNDAGAATDSDFFATVICGS